MYAAIRQGKAKAGMAEELARRIKEGAIPIISDVPSFQAYYVISTPRARAERLEISRYTQPTYAQSLVRRPLWPAR
jgi:hypothetical protein